MGQERGVTFRGKLAGEVHIYGRGKGGHLSLHASG